MLRPEGKRGLKDAWAVAESGNAADATFIDS
jgi:hypothetical protein